MKTLFIKAKSKSKVNTKKIKGISTKLPKNIAVVYSIQFEDVAKKIREILSEKHRITCFMQVLGCSNPKFSKDTQAILLIGSGRFHAISLANNSLLPIYILEKNNLSKITEQDIIGLQKRKKASYSKFLHANKVGILISTKPGQNRLKKSLDIKNKLKKKSYLFLSNNINTQEFENFPIASYINTACPRLDMDSSIINMQDIKF